MSEVDDVNENSSFKDIDTEIVQCLHSRDKVEFRLAKLFYIVKNKENWKIRYPQICSFKELVEVCYQTSYEQARRLVHFYEVSLIRTLERTWLLSFEL